MAESLRFDLLANDRASAVFDKVGRSASDTESRFSKVSSGLATFGKVAAVGIAAGGAAAVLGGKHFLSLATDVEAMGAKAATVFGGQLGMVDKWADKNAAAMGLTGTQATGLAANFADLLIPMGFGRKQAAGMATDVVGLSGALSQWSGGTISAAEASDVLAKAMLGERDGLKALGISISDADVKARLLKNGQDKLTGAALQQATAQATQQLIMEKSTDAQAAYAKGGSPLLSSQAKIKAAFGELQETIAKKLIPVFTSMVGGVAEIAAAFQKGGIGGAVEKIGKMISDAAPVIMAKLSEWGTAFVEWAGKAIPPMLVKLGALQERVLSWVMANQPRLVEKLAKWGEALIEWVIPMIPPLLVHMSKLVWRLQDWVITQGLPALAKAAVKLGIAFIKGLHEGINEAFEPLVAKISNIKSRIADKFRNAPTMLLAEGRQLISGLIGGIGEKLSDLGEKISNAKDRIASKFDNAMTMLTGDGRQIIGGLIGGIGERLADLGQKISDAKSRIVDKFVGAGEWLLGEGRQVVGGLIGGIGEKFEELGTKVGSVKGKVAGYFSNASTWLYSSGASLIQGLIDGIASKISAVTSMISNLAGKVKRFFPGSPVKEGPLTAWNNGAAGKRLVGMIADGLSDTRPIDSAMQNLASHADLTGSGAITLGSSGGAAAGAGGGGVVYNFVINGATDPNATVAAIHSYVKRNGPLRGVTA